MRRSARGRNRKRSTRIFKLLIWRHGNRVAQGSRLQTCMIAGSRVCSRATRVCTEPHCLHGSLKRLSWGTESIQGGLFHRAPYLSHVRKDANQEAHHRREYRVPDEDVHEVDLRSTEAQGWSLEGR